jgi:iron complex outermembrane receptor protein
MFRPAHSPSIKVPADSTSGILRRRAISLAIGLLLSSGLMTAPAQADEPSLADIPFDQLLQTDVVTAAKITRQISGAASAVSVVTAEDIRTFGYRTLGEILDSMRGLTIAKDNLYGYLGERGYGNPSYSAKVVLLIDGYRATENYFGHTFYGNEGLIDVELIERVEYIPGSGSSTYGDSAFRGVINVITKKGRDIDGTVVGAGFGSHGARSNRVTFGRQLENGADLVLSASGLAGNGRGLPAEFADSSAAKSEVDSNRRYFAKASYAGWTFEAAFARRDLGDWQPGYCWIDESAFYRLRHDADLSQDTKLSVDFYQGRYRNTSGTSDHSFFEIAGGDWRGLDAKFVLTAFDRHTLVTGAEYRDDIRQFNHYENWPSPNVDTNRQTLSFYAYDDVALASNLTLTFGGRRDARKGAAPTFSPRAALTYIPVAGTTIKLSAGEAHRQLTAWTEREIVWADPKPERQRSQELVIEQALGPKTRVIGSLYRYRLTNWLQNFYADGTADYATRTARGAEFELEHLWDNGTRLRASYARQTSHINDTETPVNVPSDIAKLNLSVPLAGNDTRAGIGVRYMGRRLNYLNEYEPATTITDLTLSGRWKDWGASVSVRNLFNRSYTTVSGYDPNYDPQNPVPTRGAYPGDGRNVWFQLEYSFK